MIQDIEPHKYHVEYKPEHPQDDDVLLIYRDSQILLSCKDNEIDYPTIAAMGSVYPDTEQDAKFLFRIDKVDYYEIRKAAIEPFGPYYYEKLPFLRSAQPKWRCFAGITGHQIHQWYNDTRYCGRCATKMVPKGDERAMCCPNCGKVNYPTISPSVIVGITDGDRLLLTKYSKKHGRSSNNYALVAGYTEIGETLEATVKREVMEEVGLKVKNIRYYKSQPWSFSSVLLAGFYCEVDGDPTITLEEDELSEATWFDRKDIPKDASNISLTGEMIEHFRTLGADEKL